MKKIYIIIAFVLVIIFGFLSGLYIYKLNNINKNISKKISSTIEDECTDISYAYEVGMLKTQFTNQTEEKISPDANLIMKKCYKNCKHVITEKNKIPEELVNLNEIEFKEKYNDWELEGFSSKEIVIKKEIEGICNEHYILKEKDGYIAIYTIDERENESLKEITDISISYLTNTDLIEIKNGIRAIGKEELNSLLEDYE